MSTDTTQLNSTQLAVGLSWVESYKHVMGLRLAYDSLRLAHDDVRRPMTDLTILNMSRNQMAVMNQLELYQPISAK